MIMRSIIMYDMNQLITAKRVQVIAALSLEQLEMDLLEGENEAL